MKDDLVSRWLSRALVASFLVNVLLAVWLWSASREPEDVLIATRDYVRTRVVYDSAKAERLPALIEYREARRNLPPPTPEVEAALALADTVILRDSVALAAADSALARADNVIRALKKANKPKLVQPWAEVLWSPYSREYVGRLGVDVRTIGNVSLIAAAEVRKEGPGVLLGARISF